MSEPVSSSEIEDVLSSIRKLVSEDSRAKPETNNLVPPENDDGQLVLTSDFRVNQPAQPVPDTEPLTLVNALPREIKEEQPNLAPRAQSDGEENAETESSAVALDIPAETVAAASSLSLLEQTIAELEAAVGDQEDEWEPDGTDPDVERPDHVPGYERDLKLVVDAEAKPDSDIEAQFEPAPSNSSKIGAIADDISVEVDEDVAEAEAETETEADNNNRDIVGNPSIAPANKASSKLTAVENHDAAIFETEVAEKNEAITLSDGVGSLDVYDDDGILDEQMLRDIVGEVVREELQGPLGERITRNLRKLVRREVRRSLSAQEID